MSKKINTNIVYYFVVAITICIIILPMNLCPIWNGQIPDQRNQYEVLAESIINEGDFSLDYEVDPKLASMDNPYDREARDRLGVHYNWDTAFYNNTYYMYFGIVPIFLAFLPYRIITGTSLTTYHATQLFSAFFVLGLFQLIRLFSRRMFFHLKIYRELFWGFALSIISLWYIVSAPALYCTAISAGLCMEIWSLYFFIKAFYFIKEEKKQNIILFFGALFGALSFGCRPTVALANLIVPFLLVKYIKEKKKAGTLSVLKLLATLVPYFIIGALLMYYNYVRFDNVFEFGQSYQLTVADQSRYGSFFNRIDIDKIIDTFTLLMSEGWRYDGFAGLLVEYPFLLSIVLLLVYPIYKRHIKNGLFLLTLGMIISVIMIIFMQIMESPVLLERYKSDYLWLLCIMVFLVAGNVSDLTGENSNYKYLLIAIEVMVFIGVVYSAVLFFTPYDFNYADYFKLNSEDYIKYFKLFPLA